MTFYNIHTHARREGEVSILNVFPENFDDKEQGVVSCGYHPWYVDEDQSFDVLEHIVQQSNVVAIGETGFDSLKGASMEVQRVCFEKHIVLSERYKKPLIIHCVRAWDWLIAAHKKYDPKQTWILHAFRGKPDQMHQFLQKGMKFSVGMYFNEECVRKIPTESLFLETDDSDVTIEEIYKLVAETRRIDLKALVSDVEMNVKEVFKVSL